MSNSITDFGGSDRKRCVLRELGGQGILEVCNLMDGALILVTSDDSVPARLGSKRSIQELPLGLLKGLK